MYARVILEELKSSSPDFDRLCNHMSEIQQLTLTRTKGHVHKKGVHLSSVDRDGKFCGKCRNYITACRYHLKECKQHKGNLQGGRSHDSEGAAMTVMVGLAKCAFFAVSRGTMRPHVLKRLLRRHPHCGKKRMQRPNWPQQVPRFC
jgi:hypothetical protein